METKQEYAIQIQPEGYIAPAATVKDALLRYQAMKEFVDGILKPKVDYGTIPGTSEKPTLLKPGAEKLASFFGLRPVFSVNERVDDWTGENHGSEPFFLRDYKCQLYRTGELIGEGCGSCNSWESKYRYRNSKRVCPVCGKETIIKGKEQYGGGWLCYAKQGGCGAKFKDNDPQITGQELGKVKNPDIFDQVNTIDKMAQKRALIAAVLIATNASDYFTQDIEDFVDANFSEMNEPADAPLLIKPQPKTQHYPADNRSIISYEDACNITGSDKRKYGNCTNEELEGKRIGILKALKGDVDAVKQSQYQNKLEAIKVLLAVPEPERLKLAGQPELTDAVIETMGLDA